MKIHPTTSAVMLSEAKDLGFDFTGTGYLEMQGLASLTSSAALQLRLLRMTTISQVNKLCRAGAPPARQPDAVGLQEARSENIKSSHQFLARFHRLRWIHPAEHLFPTLTIHCCEFAHELVARFPFCVFARANADR